MKSEVITDLKQTKGIEEYILLLNKARKEMKLENISEEYIREYLSAAGYTIKQYELWEKYKF